MSKKIASSLLGILEDSVMVGIQDKTSDIEPSLVKLMDHWNFDLDAKKPGVAHQIIGGDEVKFTRLDLSTFLMALIDRNAVINLPVYKSRRATTVREGENVLSNKNRHGEILSLTSNQKAFSFGVRIKDENVLSESKDGTETLGQFRTFLITDLTGGMYDGWQTLQFVPSSAENNWMNTNYFKDDVKDNKIYFDKFVAPEKWAAFYGKYYFMSKAMESRLSDEIRHLKHSIKSLIEDGIKYPPGFEAPPVDWPKQTKGEYDTEKIWAFQAEIDIPAPKLETEYADIETTQDGLVGATRKRKRLEKALAKCRFINRSVELAFSQKHPNDVTKAERPQVHWVKGVEWEKYTAAGKRTEWNRLKIFQPGVGELSVALRYRWWEKTEQVAKDVNSRLRINS